MKPGDKIVYYLTGRKAFGGIVTIESPYFESHDRIWESGDPKKAAEDYPFRVEIAPDMILPLAEAVPAEPIARQMAYVAKWPAANWTLAFQGNVHEIGDGRLPLDSRRHRVGVACWSRCCRRMTGRRWDRVRRASSTGSTSALDRTAPSAAAGTVAGSRAGGARGGAERAGRDPGHDLPQPL